MRPLFFVVSLAFAMGLAVEADAQPDNNRASDVANQMVSGVRTLCLANDADQTGVRAAALQDGWVQNTSLPVSIALRFGKVRSETNYDLTVKEFATTGGIVRVCSISVENAPGTPFAALQSFLGRSPTASAQGYEVWSYEEQGGRRVFLETADAVKAAKARQATVHTFSGGMYDHMAAVIYTVSSPSR
jgi:hypothetical protein